MSNTSTHELTKYWTHLEKLLYPDISRYISHCIREVERYNQQTRGKRTWGREEYEAQRQMDECLNKYRER